MIFNKSAVCNKVIFVFDKSVITGSSTDCNTKYSMCQMEVTDNYFLKSFRNNAIMTPREV